MSDFGKGLGALIPSGVSRPPAVMSAVVLPAHEPNEGDVFAVLNVSPDKIDPNPRQPRTMFNEEALSELQSSIAQHGILEPLIVTQKPDGRFELIAGERRLRACMALGLKKVPVVVRHADDLEKLELSLIENLQRQDLNPIEEAEGYRELVETFGLTQEDAARASGKSRETVSNMLRLLTLPVEMQKMIGVRKLSIAHARVLLSIDNPRARQEIFDRIVKDGLSAKDAEALASPKMRPKKTLTKDPAISADELRLREALNTKVQIEKRGERGKISVHFYSQEDYKELVGKLAD